MLALSLPFAARTAPLPAPRPSVPPLSLRVCALKSSCNFPHIFSFASLRSLACRLALCASSYSSRDEEVSSMRVFEELEGAETLLDDPRVLVDARS